MGANFQIYDYNASEGDKFDVDSSLIFNDTLYLRGNKAYEGTSTAFDGVYYGNVEDGKVGYYVATASNLGKSIFMIVVDEGTPYTDLNITFTDPDIQLEVF